MAVAVLAWLFTRLPPYLPARLADGVNWEALWFKDRRGERSTLGELLAKQHLQRTAVRHYLELEQARLDIGDTGSYVRAAMRCCKCKRLLLTFALSPIDRTLLSRAEKQALNAQVSRGPLLRDQAQIHTRGACGLKSMAAALMLAAVAGCQVKGIACGVAYFSLCDQSSHPQRSCAGLGIC